MLLRSLFDKSAGDSDVQLVTVVGEPGVGKSRLVAELFAYIDERDELVIVASGPLPAVRRRDHLLGTRRDRQGACRDLRVGLGRAGGGEARCAPSGRRGPGVAACAARAARGSGVRSATVARGVVRRLAALPRGHCRRGAVRRRRGGHPLGRRCHARVSRTCRRLGAGRLADARLYRPARAVRAPFVVGGGTLQRDCDPSLAALGSRHSAARRGAPRAGGPAGGDAADRSGTGGRESSLRRGVRADAARSGPARRAGGTCARAPCRSFRTRSRP